MKTNIPQNQHGPSKNEKDTERSIFIVLGTLFGGITSFLTSVIKGGFDADKIKTATNPGEYFISFYDPKIYPFRSLAIDFTLQELEKHPDKFRDVLMTLTDRGHVTGLKDMLKFISNAPSYTNYLPSAPFAQFLSYFKEAQKQAIKNGNPEVIALFEAGIIKLDMIHKHYNRRFNVNTHDIEQAKLSSHLITIGPPVSTQMSTPNHSTSLTQTLETSVSTSGTIAPSITSDANFTMNSIIAAAIVLRMCGMDKFTKFAFPPTPIKLTRDYELQNNNWTPQEFEKLLHKNPEAQIIATAITNQIKQSGTTNWAPEQIVEFVESAEFRKILEATRNATRTSVLLKESDLGGTPPKTTTLRGSTAKTSKYDSSNTPSKTKRLRGR